MEISVHGTAFYVLRFLFVCYYIREDVFELEMEFPKCSKGFN